MEARPMALTELGRHDRIERLADRIGHSEQSRRAGTPVADHAGRVHEHYCGRLMRFHSSRLARRSACMPISRACRSLFRGPGELADYQILTWLPTPSLRALSRTRAAAAASWTATPTDL